MLPACRYHSQPDAATLHQILLFKLQIFSSFREISLLFRKRSDQIFFLVTEKSVLMQLIKDKSSPFRFIKNVFGLNKNTEVAETAKCPTDAANSQLFLLRCRFLCEARVPTEASAVLGDVRVLLGDVRVLSEAWASGEAPAVSAEAPALALLFPLYSLVSKILLSTLRTSS